MVFYEAPPRLADLLEDLVPLAGAEREVVVARELTKLFEEFRRGTLAELAPYYHAAPPRGEITVVMAGRTGDPATGVAPMAVWPSPRRSSPAVPRARRRCSSWSSELGCPPQ